MKRKETKYIVIHCTATSQLATVQAIKNYWKQVLGWKNVGYYAIIMPSGNVEYLAEDDDVTNGASGYNSVSVHISWLGGEKSDNRTYPQIESMKNLVKTLREKYPDAKIVGHRDFPYVKKLCPYFDVAEWIKTEELE